MPPASALVTRLEIAPRDYREQPSNLDAEQALLGKVCAPEDVAAAILSLITGSDLVTGQVLVCDGGHTLGPRLADGIK